DYYCSSYVGSNILF
nr:immunoglobulin light chain junction region [Macaca mulatta]